MAAKVGKSTKGRWMYHLIPGIYIWTNRKLGEVDHYLNQLLTRQGCFQFYQYQFSIDDVENRTFMIPVSVLQKGKELCENLHLQKQLITEILVFQVTKSEENWNAEVYYAT